MDSIELEVMRQTIVLSSTCTAFLPLQKTLLVADLHLGKEATFRRAGIAVPSGSTLGTLRRLAEAIDRFEPERCVILGDLVHAKDSLTDSIFDQFRTWLNQFENRCKFTLTIGNHDLRSKQQLRSLAIELVDEQMLGDCLRLIHDPLSVDQTTLIAKQQFAIGGHMHPGFKLSSRAGENQKVPCFWLQSNRLILPAMGEFTGTAKINLQADQRAFLVCDDELVCLEGRLLASC